MNINELFGLCCLILGVLFIVMMIVFAVLKEKGAILISGFNTLIKEEQAKYDHKKMSADMRNSLLLWSVVLLAGALLSYLFSYYFAAGALIIWMVLFFKEVKLNPKKAFEKYKR